MVIFSKQTTHYTDFSTCIHKWSHVLEDDCINFVKTSYTSLFNSLLHVLFRTMKQKQTLLKLRTYLTRNMVSIFIKTYVTENNVTVIWPNSVSDGESVWTSILMTNVVDDKWWTLIALFEVYLSSGFDVYHFSIFWPINRMYCRMSIDYRNISNQFNWTSFVIIFVRGRNDWRFCNDARLEIMIIYYFNNNVNSFIY